MICADMAYFVDENTLLRINDEAGVYELVTQSTETGEIKIILDIFNDFPASVNAFHGLAERQNLRRADCGCCWNQRNNPALCAQHETRTLIAGQYMRHPDCVEHEKGSMEGYGD